MEKFREIFSMPPRLFAVGDIHGCSEELSAMLTHFEEVERLTNDDVVIFIGDYIDRGPDSKGVITALIEFGKKFPSTIFLRGNHEDMLLGFLGFGGSQDHPFLYNGGKEFLKSYGIGLTDVPEDVVNQLPRDHVVFLINLETYVIIGDYVFVHAGLSPLRDLRTQLNQDLFWIRDEFINNVHKFGKTVVFGHTPYEKVFFHLPYKIGIDTGLVFGNHLSAIELVSKRVLKIARGSSSVKEERFG